MFSTMELQEKRQIVSKPVFAEIPTKYYLSEEQLRFYKENGFLVIKQLIDFGSLYSFRQRFQQIAKGIVPKGAITVVKEPSLRHKKNPEDYINKLQEILYDDVFIQYAQHPQMYHVLTQLIGDDITAIHSMFINKPPGTGRHPPHQDLYYFPYRPADKIVASWTAVDDVIMENGCLYVVPGSHKRGVIYEHTDQKDGKLYHGIVEENTAAPLKARVHLEMSPGDTVFFHPCLVHGSTPNISKGYRKSITFHFVNSDGVFVEPDPVQATLAREIEDEARRRGLDQMSFAQIWQMKSRRITGLRAHL